MGIPSACPVNGSRAAGRGMCWHLQGPVRPWGVLLLPREPVRQREHGRGNTRSPHPHRLVAREAPVLLAWPRSRKRCCQDAPGRASVTVTSRAAPGPRDRAGGAGASSLTLSHFPRSHDSWATRPHAPRGGCQNPLSLKLGNTSCPLAPPVATPCTLWLSRGRSCSRKAWCPVCTTRAAPTAPSPPPPSALLSGRVRRGGR